MPVRIGWQDPDRKDRRLVQAENSLDAAHDELVEIKIQLFGQALKPDGSWAQKTVEEKHADA